MKTAVDNAVKYKIVFVGEDTDPLRLLRYFASSDANEISLKPEQRRNM